MWGESLSHPSVHYPRRRGVFSLLYHLPLFFLIKHNHDYNEWSRGNDMPQQTPRSWTNCSISSHCPVQNPFFSFEKGDKLCNIEQILHHMVALRIWQSQQTIPARLILQLPRPLWLQYGSLRPRVSCPAGIDHACQGELPRSLWPLFSPHTAVISKSYSPIQPDVSKSPPYAP